MSLDPFDFVPQLERELGLPPKAIRAVIALLSDGNTVPFIARYRKEVTGNLDEVQIHAIQESLQYAVEMQERRNTILDTIQGQGKLTEDLKAKIDACRTKNELEDLYLPYKPKRRTRAMIAREKGLEPLAAIIVEQPLEGAVDAAAALFVDADKGVATVAEALKGACDIVAEAISEEAALRSYIRQEYLDSGVVVSKVLDGKESAPTKFELYYDYREAVKSIPSHRYLAIRRGEKEEILDMRIEVDGDGIVDYMRKFMRLNLASPFAASLDGAIRDAFKRFIAPSVESDVRLHLKTNSDKDAVVIFADNLRNLLMASPLGAKPVIGIDPGLRTGCKCAAVDATGKFLETITFYLHAPDQAKKLLIALVKKYQPTAIAIGNGTAGRETFALVRAALKESNEYAGIVVTAISEAGASVYSASEVARTEFADLDLTIRGAISIARRLQDPLAELVKVDPKAIGVGQYQHDVYQTLLHDKLSEVVESCVNNVGVDLNTASAPLLSYVSGIGPSLAAKVVRWREAHGRFCSRSQLMDVSGFGPKAYEQAAGFLRVPGSINPLDTSAVHPERYLLVEKMAQDLGVDVAALVTNNAMVAKIDLKNYISKDVGEPTLQDILSELKKPGRDPRTTFEAPKFLDGINSIDDLKEGMTLEGIVTNVTAFGAFVDIGVHQDGLIHKSQLSDRYVVDPKDVVKVGQKIDVTVLDVDKERKRISLAAVVAAKRRNNSAMPAAAPPRPKHSFAGSPFASL